jgi:hypothetical protein
MHPFAALVSQLVQYVRALIASAAPALAAPARPIYRGASEGWVLPPNAGSSPPTPTSPASPARSGASSGSASTA